MSKTFSIIQMIIVPVLLMISMPWLISKYVNAEQNLNSTLKANVTTEAGKISASEWDITLNKAGIGAKTIEKSDKSSTHLMLINGKEQPHFHDYHDLYALVTDGEVRINYKNRSQTLQSGDIAIIPKGTYHWAENIHNHPSKLFVIFTPGFDGKDRRFTK